ncbi:protein FAM83D [Carassius auratus]|uniref:Protein FAM83D-like n=1 Tax=Carassius auratus TaxID=7957 RepID=A0A6P6KZK4_CARAU|nr:protein FAM83D-like [Carassius auratus]XP_026077691.1 protein FAM83D-like [Carassius auratus]
MSNTQEQSLNENIVFAPLTESSPDFLHCEEERYCVESLVSSGAEAFYTKLHQEQIGSFLSPGEVNQISSWAEEYHQSDAIQENGNGEVEVGSDGEDFSGHYFPTESDTPAPCLELGWPERTIWMDMGQIHVFTNPPAEQAPSIREVLRRHLQGATKLIAVVTDKLSDNAVIGDLRNAASRGVPVYIILNKRSVEKSCFSQRLQHPNIMVRVLGGKTYLTRDTKVVVGELKENFVLVDLETVMFGSYSLSWTDAHLHRQLVTVLSGRAVESFDQEFRILYAASLPIPDAWKTGKEATEPKTLKKVQPLNININKVELKELVSSPPPPPTDNPLDWEEMGVIQRFPDSPLSPSDPPEIPFHHRQLLERHPGRWEPPYKEFNSRLQPGYQEDVKFSSMFLSDLRHPEYQRPRRHYAPGEMHCNEVVNRPPLQIPDRITYPLLNAENEERFPLYKSRAHRMDMTSEEELGAAVRREPYQMSDRALGETMNLEGSTQAHFKKPSELSRSRTFNTLSDIMKRVNARSSSSGQQRTDTRAPGVSKSTLDLNLQRSDTASNARTTNGDNLPLTPALALMKKRNDEVKSGLLRSMPSVFTPGSRTPKFGLQREPWRAPFKSHRSEEEH